MTAKKRRRRRSKGNGKGIQARACSTREGKGLGIPSFPPGIPFPLVFQRLRPREKKANVWEH